MTVVVNNAQLGNLGNNRSHLTSDPHNRRSVLKMLEIWKLDTLERGKLKNIEKMKMVEYDYNRRSEHVMQGDNNGWFWFF